MKCRSCGYLSLEARERCPRCGESFDAPPPAGGAAGLAGLRLVPEPDAGAAPGEPALAALELPPEEPAVDRLVDLAEFADDENLPDVDRYVPGHDPQLFFLEDDLIPPELPPDDAGGSGAQPGSGEDPAFAWPREPERPEAVIDREEAVPEQFWAPEGAGLGRRAAAATVDALVLAGALALFAGGAWLALRAGGLAAGSLLEEATLRAVALPFLLLALLLGFCYSVFFHAAGGATPGKRLARLEVRAADGGPLRLRRVLLRWAAAVLAAVPLGAGFLWAFFDPRRRGWADLASGTVVAGRSRGAVAEGPAGDGGERSPEPGWRR